MRENAGMSSENYVRIIMAENLRFPEEGSSAQGKPGVAPVVKDTIEWKVTWMETRKAVCIWKEPVPQTDTGR